MLALSRWRTILKKAVGPTAGVFLSVGLAAWARPALAQEVRISSPSTEVELNDYELSDLLERIEKSFTGSFAREADPDLPAEKFPQGSVDLRLETNNYGLEEPVIGLRSYGNEVSKIYFSQIGRIKDGVKTYEGKKLYHLLLEHNVPITGKNGLRGKKTVRYDFLITDEPDMIASFIQLLSQDYANLVREKKPKVRKACPAFEQVYVSYSELELICNPEDQNKLRGREVHFLGSVYYDECVYKAEESKEGLRQTMEDLLSRVVEQREGILVICGGADQQSARRCLASKDNLALSFLRAKSLAKYIEGGLGEAGKKLTSIPYPTGDAYDGRISDLFYVTPKRGESK